MKTLKEILAALEAANNELKAMHDRAKAETDATKKAGINALIEAKRAEIEGLKGDLEAAKTQAETDKLIAGAKALLEPDGEGKTLNPAGQPGEQKVTTPPRGAAGKEEDHRKFFLEWFEGKNLSGQAMDLISASQDRFLKVAEGAIMLPRSMAAKIASIVGCAQGKTVLFTDSTGVATDSGAANTIPSQQLIPQVIMRPLPSAALADQVTRVPAGAGTATYPTGDHSQGTHLGVAFTWKSADGADKTETEPTFGTWTIATHELSGWTQLSLAVIRRAVINLEAFLVQLFQAAARYELSNKILNGTNANGQPMGIIHSTNTTLVKVNRAVASQVSYADLRNLQYNINMMERAGARFILHDNVEKYLLTQTDGMDRPLFTDDLLGGQRLLKQSYDATLINPDLGTLGDVVWGNPANYGLGIEEDMAIARSEHAEFKRGLIVFRLIMMAGGAPFRGDAFAALDVPAA